MTHFVASRYDAPVVSSDVPRRSTSDIPKRRRSRAMHKFAHNYPSKQARRPLEFLSALRAVTASLSLPLVRLSLAQYRSLLIFRARFRLSDCRDSFFGAVSVTLARASDGICFETFPRA
jgi:hypothetical protein